MKAGVSSPEILLGFLLTDAFKSEGDAAEAGVKMVKLLCEK
jgi:hypothetical protein